MNFKDKIKSKNFVITCEVGPPKGTNIYKILDKIGYLKGRVDAINVTDSQSSIMKLGSLATCHLIKVRGHEPIFQITARDRNRLALQSDILSADVLGIKNALILTGDHPSKGDHPQAKAVYDLDSVQLLGVVKQLNTGVDMAGNKLDGKCDIFPGAVVNPGADFLEPEIIKMEKKVKAGARFFQTQAVFDAKSFADFMKKTKHINVPIIASVILLKSPAMARYMNNNVAGIKVPEKIINEIEDTNKADRIKKVVEIAARLIKELRPLCNGIHIMPVGWESKIGLVLDAAEL